MKTLILFYTFGGVTRKEALRLTDELQKSGNVIKCTEITEQKPRSLLGCFFSGCPKALQRKASKIVPVQIDQDADRFIIGCPIWAGFPVPAFNAIISLIPDGKEVELFFCSSGGETPKSKEGTIDLIKSKGLTLISYRDIKTNERPKKEVR